MSMVIRIHQTGGPEVMRWEDQSTGTPGSGEALLRHEAIGLNFIDVYHRTGLYPLASLPAVLGMEGAGVVEAVGEGVSEVRVGDRVAYAGVPPGAYARQRLIPAHRLVKLPDQISSEQAASIMLKGMTARYLLYGCYRVKPGDKILLHAVAGGVGTLVCQWARHLGATVIGTVGSREKADLVKNLGCDYAILYQEEDFAARVMEITSGEGVHVVYDSVGQATFMKSLSCLRPMGTMVSFGQSSGPVTAFDPSILAAKGSLFLTRPSLMHYTAKRRDLIDHAADLFEVIQKGIVKVAINQRYPLAEAAKAHRDLEARATTGASILVP